MNHVSSCCKGEIVQMEQKHYPLGGTAYYERFVYDGCNECGEEIVDVLTTCDCCGEASEEFIQVELGDWCKKCVALYAEDLVENAVRRVTA